MLTDDAFHAAATRPNKTHHTDPTRSEKSVTPQNPSRPDVDLGSAVDATTEPSQGADDGFESRSNPAMQADPVSILAKSIMSTSAKSLTVPATESITAENPEVGRDEPPATGVVQASGAQTPSPPSAQSPSPLPAPAGSERQRSPMSRPSDGDLVPLTRTSPRQPDAHTPAPAPRAPSPRRLSTRPATVLLVVMLAATAALVIYRPWEQASRPESSAGHTPAARGAPAKATGPGPAKLLVSRAREARGGLARSTTAPAKTPTTKSQTFTAPSPAETAAQPVTRSREHRQHPITPCQSTGICVR